MCDCWIITFESIHRVLKAEKLLKENNISVNVIPVPRDISADCGIGLEISGAEYGKIKKILLENKILPLGFYCKGKKEVYETFN